MSAVFLAGLLASALAIPIPTPQTSWFTQNLDHFNDQDTRTFSQRVLTYSDAFDAATGVIFFYAGNEGPIDSFYNNTGWLFDRAAEFKALVMFAEHRYYGKTLPFGAESFQTKNMAYLAIEQAVADYAVLLTDYKMKNNLAKTPVVVFGGSYGGVLATLCRIHYPAVFDMALAASAPIPQTLNTVNGTTFFGLVTKDYLDVNPQCVANIRSGFADLLAQAAAGNFAAITSEFKLCKPLTQADLEHLILWAQNGMLTIAMVDYPYAASFLGSLPAWPVNVSCAMGIAGGPTMKSVAMAAGLFYNASAGNSLKCFDIYTEFVECADQTGCGLGDDAKAWDYQMCTEIVYAMITNNVTDMFPPRVWNFDSLKAYCMKTYNVVPNPDWMQVYFPLDVAKATSRIIFSNGLLDPWHGGGYLKNLAPDLPVVIVPSGAHHLDLRSSNPKDPQNVVMARNQEVSIFKGWLQQMRNEEKVAVDKVTPVKLQK